MQRWPKKRYAKSATKETLIRDFSVIEGKKNCRILLFTVILFETSYLMRSDRDPP